MNFVKIVDVRSETIIASRDLKVLRLKSIESFFFANLFIQKGTDIFQQKHRLLPIDSTAYGNILAHPPFEREPLPRLIFFWIDLQRMAINDRLDADHLPKHIRQFSMT